MFGFIKNEKEFALHECLINGAIKKIPKIIKKKIKINKPSVVFDFFNIYV